MKMKYTLSSFLLLVTVVSFATSARILAFFPIGGSSHYNIAEALLKELAARGHNVTSVTSLPQKKAVPNFRDVDISGTRGPSANSLPFAFVQNFLQSTHKNFRTIANVSRMYCEIAFAQQKVKDLLREEFDLVISEIFGADCGVGFAWKFDAPLISILAPLRTTWSLARVGNPSNPSYMHMTHSNFPARMNFFERLVNTYWQVYYYVYYFNVHNGAHTNALSRQFFGEDVPPVNDIIYNTSVVFANNHFAISSAYPMVPNYVEIAGIHIKKPKPLPRVSISSETFANFRGGIRACPPFPMTLAKRLFQGGGEDSKNFQLERVRNPTFRKVYFLLSR